VPINAIVLRSGVPDILPGRAVNLCENGVAAVLAGELRPGEAVGVEILLPMATDLLHTRAVVKHCEKLVSGMEFVSLPPEQRAVIRNWTSTAGSPTSGSEQPGNPRGDSKGGRGGTGPRWHRPETWVWLVLLSVVILATLVWWWNWRRGWKALETGIQVQAAASISPPVQVASDVMQRLVKHRLDPEYPAAARSKKLQAVIVLDVVIGRDGSVLDVHAQNGPEVFAQAAVEAMRWWRFEPYRVDGQPVNVETTLAMEFKP
jgi:TonB family protein